MASAFIEAVTLVEQIRNGDLSPVEAVEQAIRRAEAVEPRINAIVEPTFEAARARARAVDPRRGAMAGLPILLKDYLAVDGAPVYWGNRLLKRLDVRPDHTETAARRLLDAGAVSLGTTHAPEFAAGNSPISSETALYGPTRNPWDLDRTPMGSSGGSCAAVAAGVVPLAHGSDGGGSIRIPASACGLVGLKPSRHRISPAPNADMWAGFVTNGVVSRTIRDTAFGMDVLSGPEAGDAAVPVHGVSSFQEAVAREPGRLRIGFTTDFAFTESAAPCRDAVREAAARLGALGHDVEATYPAALDRNEIFTPYAVVISGCLAAMLASREARIGRAWTEADMEPGTWALYRTGASITAADFVQAAEALVRWTREVATWWAVDGFDVLVTPTLAVEPPPTGVLVTGDQEHRTRLLRETIPFTPPFNVTGQPAISLPLHQTAAGIPIGVQLVAAHGREDLLLRLGAQLESEYAWHARIPPVHAQEAGRSSPGTSRGGSPRGS